MLHGSYWMYAKTGLYHGFDGVRWTSVPFQETLDSSWHSDNHVRDYAIFNGELWLLTRNGLVRSSSRSASIVTELSNVKSIDSPQYAETNSKLFLSDDNGLWQWTGNEFKKDSCDYSVYDTPSFEQLVQGIILDTRGEVEYILLNQGVLKDCQYTPFPKPLDYQDGDLIVPYHVTRDTENRFLLGTTDFLFAFEDGEFELVADFRTYNLPYKVHFKPWFIDSEQRIWLQWNSNENSFLILDPKDRSYRNFTSFHLFGSNIHKFYSAYQSADGVISLSTSNGLYDWSSNLQIVDMASTGFSRFFQVGLNGIQYLNQEVMTTVSPDTIERLFVDDYLGDIILSPRDGALLVGHDMFPNQSHYAAPKLYQHSSDAYQEVKSFSKFVTELGGEWNLRNADSVITSPSGSKAVAFADGPILFEKGNQWQILDTYRLPVKSQKKSLVPYQEDQFIALTLSGPVLFHTQQSTSTLLSSPENMVQIVANRQNIFSLGSSGKIYQLQEEGSSLVFNPLPYSFQGRIIGFDDSNQFFAVGPEKDYLRYKNGQWIHGQTSSWGRLGNYSGRRVNPIGFYKDHLWFWIPDKLVMHSGSTRETILP